ncbi:MAG: T9SS type A sorting domain-containing protein [Bacteroidia bacterium]|nr:T9SS type A sorting domain-containing protein [Bacteroidia bacterium]
MKKVFLLSLGLLLGATGFAQNKADLLPKTNAKKQCVNVAVKQDVLGNETSTMNFSPSEALPRATQVRDFGEWLEAATMTTRYDLQSNSSVANRIAAWGDGSAAIVATWSSDDAYNTRGAGYNYFNGTEFGNEPTERVEPVKSGWPSICAYGNSEYLASHCNGTHVYKRDVKGTGAWTDLGMATTYTWPRIAATADGTLHLIAGDQDASNTKLNYIKYFRSTDGGVTWTENEYIASLEEEYHNKIGADDYVMATNGNTIAIMFSSNQYDVFYVISHDAGLTWEKVVVAAFPYPDYDDEENWASGSPAISSLTDTIYASDNSHSIAIDNEGTVHVAFGLMAWAPAEDQQGYISIWMWMGGIVYWNSNYVNDMGTNCIPPYGTAAIDANHPEWANNGENGISSTLNYDRLIALAWGDGDEIDINPNFNIFGWQSEKNPGTPADWSAYQSNHWGWYRTYGYATTPAVAVSDDVVTVMYSQLSDLRDDGTFCYRSAFYHQRVNGVWNDPNTEVSLSTDFEHSYDEVYPTFGLSNAVGGYVWFGYSADDLQGLKLDDDQSTCSDNVIWGIRIDVDYDNVNEQKEAVYNIYPNPATDHVVVESSMNADATITFINLAGQTVKTLNRSLTVGANSINIDLESGVYFCTVNANGFNKTTKIVVK